MANTYLSFILLHSETMNNVEKLILSRDQRQAMARFLEFVNGSTQVFILKGYAGTGKTTIVKEMIKMLNDMNLKYKLLSSTGRAAKILRDATKENTSTVHSCIYSYKGFNQDVEKIIKERDGNDGVDSTGQLIIVFEPNAPEDDNQTYFYFVDEASMMSDVRDRGNCQAEFGSGRLLTDFMKYASKGKIVFIGDICQLPPVGQKISPALSADYISTHFNTSVMEVTLTDIKRQDSGNDIIIASQKIRRLYECPQPWAWAKFPLKGFRNIQLVPSQAKLVNLYIERIRKYGYNDSTLICFSNRQCDTITQIVRPALGLTSPQLQKGDLLLVTQNNYINPLMNGDLIVVDSVQMKEKRAGLTFLDVSFHEMISNRNYSQLMIADILYGNQTNLSAPQQKNLFVDFYIRMKNQDIKEKKLMDKKMIDDPYLNALRAVFGFALTCHKVQGGEWNHVFLDIPRFFAKNEKPFVYQWIYTAMTRAKQKLYLTDDFYLI